MKTITRAAGGNVKKALNQISKSNANLGSGAANMLAKQQQANPFAFGRRGLGDSKIAQTIRQMAGTPDYRSAKQRQMGLGTGATPGTGLMIGGTVIRPGGRPAVKKQGAPMGAPAVSDTTPTGGDTAPTGDGGGEGFDVEGFLDDFFSNFQMPEIVMPEMPELPDFSSMFDELSSAFDVGDPLQLAALGQAYGGNLMRARQRQRKTRADYLRNRMNNMAIGGTQALAPMMIGGGLTL